MLFMMALLLSACATQASALPPPTASPIMPSEVAASEIPPVEEATQTEATSTGDKVGLILGKLLILSLYAFPMSFALSWAFGDPKKAKIQPKMESSEAIVATKTAAKPIETNGDAAPTPTDDWKKWSEHLPQRLQKVPRVMVGLAAGAFLMVVVVIIGAFAFALYYHFSGQPEQVSQIVPRFAYWFPFALLGMVTEMPFQIIYWENGPVRVLLRLVIFWFPRIVIIAFVINPPFLQELDPATTVLTVLAIDGVLAAFCLGLYAAREQLWMNGISA
jgi:hypothetical protein